MGQRHQIFIHTRNDFENRGYERANQTHEVVFGNLTTTVLAFHHQWLYGRGPLGAALTILRASAGGRVAEEHKTNPFGWKAYEPRSGEDLAELCKYLIATYRLPLEAETDLRYSMPYFLNPGEPVMRDDFTMGDNNDGVTLIDTLTGKYCFMNIGRQYADSDSVGKLEMLVPCSAEEYVRAYYPEPDNFTNLEGRELETEEQVLQLIDCFHSYQVMSWVDINQMFPTFKPSYK